jgi:hypothetical protein
MRNAAGVDLLKLYVLAKAPGQHHVGDGSHRTEGAVSQINPGTLRQLPVMFDVVGTPLLGDWIVTHQAGSLILGKDRAIEVLHQRGDILFAQHGRGSDGIKQLLGAHIETPRQAAGQDHVAGSQTACKLSPVEKSLQGGWHPAPEVENTPAPYRIRDRSHAHIAPAL